MRGPNLAGPAVHRRGTGGACSPMGLARLVQKGGRQGADAGRGEAGPGEVNLPGSFDAGKQEIELVLDRRQQRRRDAVNAGGRGRGDAGAGTPDPGSGASGKNLATLPPSPPPRKHLPLLSPALLSLSH